MRKHLFTALSILLFLTAGAYAQGTAAPAPAATPEAAKKPPIFRPNKSQIEQVQKILKTKKLYNGDTDGKYNDETRAGIKVFQKDNGLKETGTLNRATLEAFKVELTDKQKEIPVSPNSFATPAAATDTGSSKTPSSTTNASTPPATSPAGDTPKRPAPFRANAEQIKAAQKILKDGKMYTGDETGKLDDPTREGLKKYQEANGLKVTGTLNAVTLTKMNIGLTDAQKANVAAQAAYDAANKN
jgi:peptidoglycan hydrolase-like protein with peptidoglycan-binding domain